VVQRIGSTLLMRNGSMMVLMGMGTAFRNQNDSKPDASPQLSAVSVQFTQ
jgi:hypothetical protein